MIIIIIIKHLSTKFYAVFIDFADAFGSVKHDFIFQTLEKFSIPTYICRIIEDLYRDSCFEVSSGYLLSRKVYITRGTKTGDPLSAMLFIMVIDVVCKPMLSSALISLNLHDEARLNPIPIQAFADDIVLVSHNINTILDMIAEGEGQCDKPVLRLNQQSVVSSTEEDLEIIGIQANVTRSPKSFSSRSY